MASASIIEDYLSSQDPILGSLIKLYGHCPFLSETSAPDLFDRLASSIIGQQLSTKAAAKIQSNILIASGSDVFTPDFFMHSTVETLRSYGLSMAKARTLHEISYRICSDADFLIRMKDLSNDDISSVLCQIKGIGPWTAKMFQMFALMRQDIFSLEDAGLMRGIRITYAHGNPIDPTEIERIVSMWAPYKTIGAWYMWQVANGQYQNRSTSS